VSLEIVHETLERAVARGDVPGAVALVTDRRGVVHESAAGLASVSRTAPMTPDTIFRIASMTKPITSVAVLMLREAGKLELDDPIARHVPGFVQPPVLVSFDESTGERIVRPARRAITIHDLLTHTSGFGYWFLNREILVASEGRIEHFGAPFLMHDPGERFSYGISTDIVGLVVEPLSGLPLGRFLEERITGPLGMRETRYEQPSAPDRLAGLHKLEDGKWIDGPNEPRGEAPRGGGALYSTARDYAALIRMLLNEGRADDGTRLLSPESVRLMTTNRIGSRWASTQRTAYPARTLDFAFLDGTQKFGYNLMIETRDRPQGRAAGSFGWAGIFNTYFWVDPRAGIGAVLLMQLSPFCDPRCLQLVADFESAVYRALG